MNTYWRNINSLSISLGRFIPSRFIPKKHVVRSAIRSADAARDRRDWIQAAEYYSRALAINPALAGIWVQYGHALKEAGHIEPAERAYARADKLAPDNPDTKLHLAHVRTLLHGRWIEKSRKILGRPTGPGIFIESGQLPADLVAIVSREDGLLILARQASAGAHYVMMIGEIPHALLPVDTFPALAGGQWKSSGGTAAHTEWLSQLEAMSSEVHAFFVPFDIARMNQDKSSIELQGPDRSYRIYEFPATRPDIEWELRGSAFFLRIKAPTRVRLYIDQVLCCEGECPDDEAFLVLPIPSRFFDDGVHFVQIRDAHGICVFLQDFRILPATMTPWQVLQKETTPPLPMVMAPAAKFRYRALKDHFAAAAHRLDDYEQWLFANLDYLHSVLEQGFDAIKEMRPLRFREHETPEVSVVIPVHNKATVTYFALCALLLARNDATFEVIVFDDGSTDETLNFPNLVQGVHFLRNESGQGFLRACNQAAQAARGDYVVFLNNDTEVTAGWLDELLHAFRAHKEVGLAGSRLLYPDGVQQEAGGIVWGSGNPWNYGRGANAADPRYSYVRQVDYASGAAIMVPRTVWESVGGFSDEFAPAYFEDTDLAFKIRALGLKCLYVPHSVVFHFEGVSSGTDTSSGTKKYQEINRPKFKRKWAEAFRRNGREGVDVDLEKDRGIKGRVLFIDHATPRPDFDAGSYAALQEMRLVRELGYKVTFAPANMAYLGHYTDDLQRLGIEVVFAPFYFSVEEFLQQRGAEFDIVYITRYQIALQVLDAIHRHAPQTKILFNNADLHFLRELRAAANSGDATARQAAMRTRDEELAVMRRVDIVLSYNEVEHAVIASHDVDPRKIMKCPWVVDLPSSVSPHRERQGVSFLGGFDHPPNREAVFFFIESVMPLLREKELKATFSVYGSKTPASLVALSAPDIAIRGYVKDVNEVYDQSRVFVAPLLSGAGIKGKVVAAMAHGVPCVLSPIAAEGIGVRSGYDCLIAETPQQWADAVLRLHQDERLWEQISVNARALVQEQYSFETGVRQMRRVFQAVGFD